MLTLSEFTARISSLQWSAIEHGAVQMALLQEVAFARPDFLETLLDHSLSAPALRSLAETNATLRRLVLFQCAETGARLRFHMFHPGADARPHDHAWPFCSFLLTGGYEHSLFIRDATGTQGAPVHIMTHDLGPGQSYFLGAKAIHRTSVRTPTASFILQGPREQAGWTRFACRQERYGAAPSGNPGGRRLSDGELRELADACRAAARSFQNDAPSA